MKKTKIVCTIGPTCCSEEMLVKMIKNGMNVARFNMSHGTVESQSENIKTFYRAREKANLPCSAMVDISGPSVRIGKFENKKVLLEAGQKFVFTTKKVLGNKDKVEILYKDLVKETKKSDKLFVDNGLIEFKVVDLTKTEIITKVVNGGYISTNKSVCLPGLKLKMTYLSKKDKACLDMAAALKVEMVSISFVTSAKNVIDARKYLAKQGGKQFIISKIENQEGLNNLDSIIKASDAIMVARGDLGTEIPIEQVPAIQKQMIKQTLAQNKSIIVATEMLESMIEKIRPTRAETADVANAVYDLTSATMLSGETANGKYPLETLQTMAKIASATEQVVDYNNFDQNFDTNDPELAIAYSAVITAKNTNAKAIVCFTKSGKTANLISKFRPSATILAVTNNREVYNKLSLIWGVVPVFDKGTKTTSQMVDEAGELAKQNKVAKVGETIVVTASIPANSGQTNMIKIAKV